MLPQVLQKSRFKDFAAYLLGQGRLLAPMAKGHQFAFQEVESPQDIGRIRPDYDITILPPKKYLMPQHDTLLSFRGLGPEGAEPAQDGGHQTILCVHPYDLNGIATLDAAFAQAPQDTIYLSRRRATRLIGMNIKGYINKHQFMADMGSLTPPEGGFDLFLTDLGDRYFVEVGTQAGLEMVKASGLFEPAGDKDNKARQAYEQTKTFNCPKRLPYDTSCLPGLLEASYDSLLWEAVARRCFGCGTCTNVCPTCYCFDVQDKLNIDAVSGSRQRRWDSCQLREFAEVAGGENFREHRSSRLRHRVFRKGKYILERTGRTGCVGCGRCIHHCVASISILEAFQQIAGETAQADSASA